MKKFIILILLTITNTCFATAYYVDVTRPDDTGNGLTEATAKKTIAAALALTVAGDVVWVQNTGTYQPGATLTIPTNVISVVGYSTTIEDEDKWWTGDLGDITEPIKTRSRVSIDFEDGGYAGFTMVDRLNTTLANLQLDNVVVTQDPISFGASTWGVSEGLHLNNIWFTGGKQIDATTVVGAYIQQCYFSGDWDLAVGSKEWAGGVIMACQIMTLDSNWIEINSGDGFVNTVDTQGTENANTGGVVLSNNYISTTDSAALGKELVRARHGINAFNNIFHQRSGATYGNEIGADNTLLQFGDTAVVGRVINNIFISDNTGSPAVAINVDGSGVPSKQPPTAGYNCFWNTLIDEYSLRDGDIQENPLFLNLPETLQLSPNSPCFNSGHPDLGGGGGSIGATQPATDTDPGDNRGRYKQLNYYPN